MNPDLRRFLSTLRLRYPRLARLARWIRPRVLWRRLRLKGRDREEVFTYIHANQLWDSSESLSGAGSTLAATAGIREELPGILASLGVRSLLDAPCGDFHWMKDTQLDLDLYIGGDIVKSLVDRMNERYGGDARRFVHLDIICDPLPEADALLCRDCFLHLSNSEILQALDNISRSPCTYLLASTYPNCAHNVDIRTGLSRPVNLCLPPFNLQEPMRIFAESVSHVSGKCLGVWDLRAWSGR